MAAAHSPASFRYEPASFAVTSTTRLPPARADWIRSATCRSAASQLTGCHAPALAATGPLSRSGS